MAARFNPPPGWQVPAGFRPAPGWSPDPDWPLAPAGWEYWIDEAAAVGPATAASPAEPRRTRSVARQGAAIPLPAGPLGHLRDGVTPSPEPQGPTQPASAGSGRTGRKGGPPWLVPGVAIACFAFGVIIGVVASLARSSDAAQATLDAQRTQAQVVADRDDLNAQRADIEADKKALADREADLTAREAGLTQREADLASQQVQIDQQRQQAALKDQQAHREQQALQDQQGRGGGGGFQTCDELRAQGVQTPVRKGDPGYARFLDPDGNDMACE